MMPITNLTRPSIVCETDIYLETLVLILHYDITNTVAWLRVKHIKTFRVEAHDNVCYQSYFFFILKIYVTPFKMPNYPFGGNYPQVKNHWSTVLTFRLRKEDDRFVCGDF